MASSTSDSNTAYAKFDAETGETGSTSSSSSSSSSTDSWVEKNKRYLAIAGGAILALIVLLAIISYSSRDKNNSSVVHPACVDFYQFGCADWLNATPQPDAYASYARSFTAMQITNNNYLNDLLANPTFTHPDLEHFYQSCLDIAGIDSNAITAFNEIVHVFARSASDWPTFMAAVGSLRMQSGADFYYTTSIGVDSSAPYQAVTSINQAGLLPNNRTAYNDSEALGKITATIASAFTMLGDSAADATSNAQLAVSVLTLIAQITQPNPARGVPTPNRTISSGQELERIGVYLPDFYQGMAGIHHNRLVEIPRDNYVVRLLRPAYFDGLKTTKGLMFDARPSSAHVQYVRWILLSALTPYLGSVFNPLMATLNEYYAISPLKATPMIGLEEPTWSKFPLDFSLPTIDFAQPRNITCNALVRRPMLTSDLLSKAFMDVNFNSSVRSFVYDMTESIRSSWTQWLNTNVSWIDAESRGRLIEKNKQMQYYLGGPPPADGYTNIQISPDGKSFLKNVMELTRIHMESDASAMQDYDEKGRRYRYNTIRYWRGQGAQTVNAFYSSAQSSFFLYGGYFQSPFFSLDPTDVTMNFPWAGEVGGHELGHGFDQSGIQWNAIGAFQPDWLNQGMRTEFASRAQCLKDSYSTLSAQGKFVNGTTTITENMADIVGIRTAWISYQAFKQMPAFASQKIPASFLPKVDNLDQYFMARWAQTECVKQTDASLQRQIETDPHAPGFARINGAAMAFQPFKDTFNCPAGSPMAPVQPCFMY